MNSKDFPGANATYKASNLNEKEMRAYVNGGIRVTCWEPTPEELKEFLEHKKLYLLEVSPATAIKLVTTNPIPKFQQLQFPPLMKYEKDSPKKA